MNPIIKPAFYLMNRLSYRNKFILIASLFAIPLLVFSSQLAMRYHSQLHQAQITQSGIKHLRSASYLIQYMEQLRDTAVNHLAREKTPFSVPFNEALNKISNLLSRLKAEPALKKHHTFIDALWNELDQNRVMPGSEGNWLQSIFENTDALVEKAYLWRLKLSYEFVPSSNSSKNIITILDIINTSKPYFLSLGEARAYGSFYLQQQFIDSRGIQLVDSNYRSIKRLIDDSEVKTLERRQLYATYPESQMETATGLLMQMQLLVQEQLIEAISLEADALKYYRQVSNIMSPFYSHNSKLLDLVESLLTDRLTQSRNELTKFYALAGAMVLLLSYLFIGFFSYLSGAVRDLVDSARHVADGKYDTPIQLRAQDELVPLANAMDEMRLKLKEREEELKLAGQTDGLTGLSNRKYFDDSYDILISLAKRRQVPLVLVMMDIDHFKAVNDQHGHLAGDECLIEVASLFKAQFQRQSDVVARYGGEEFIAVLYDISVNEAVNKVEQLRQKIQQTHIHVNEIRLNVTASFGVAILTPSPAANEDELLSYADTLLYKAKRSGRNRVETGYFTPSTAIPPDEKGGPGYV